MPGFFHISSYILLFIYEHYIENTKCVFVKTNIIHSSHIYLKLSFKKKKKADSFALDISSFACSVTYNIYLTPLPLFWLTKQKRVICLKTVTNSQKKKKTG